jgi:type I restriction enzyme M protein
VLDDKWHATITGRIAGEVNSLTLGLVSRIQELGERYAVTFGELRDEMQRLDAKVVDHLSAMGVK